MKKRPRDPVQLAKMIVDIATGEIEDPLKTAETSDPAAVKRGKARADKLTPERRVEIAKAAADKRWHKT